MPAHEVDSETNTTPRSEDPLRGILTSVWKRRLCIPFVVGLSLMYLRTSERSSAASFLGIVFRMMPTPVCLIRLIVASSTLLFLTSSNSTSGKIEGPRSLASRTFASTTGIKRFQLARIASPCCPIIWRFNCAKRGGNSCASSRLSEAKTEEMSPSSFGRRFRGTYVFADGRQFGAFILASMILNMSLEWNGKTRRITGWTL